MGFVPEHSISGIDDLKNRYRLVAKLGSGGMADVFLGVQLGEQEFERLVVIKKVHAAGMAVENMDALKMFVDEARLVATLNHPHVVKVYDLARQDDGIFIAMEYVDGETFAYMIKSLLKSNERIPLPVACRLMIQACEALHYAHAAATPDGTPLNLIHRDIDVQNLMCDRNGYLKIIDFGIAKSESQTEMTAPGLFKGKLSYVAPDLFKFKNIDKRVDIYSLGLVFYAMVTRKKPYPFKKDVSLAEVIDRILKERLPPLSSIDSTLPRALDEVISKATNKERDQRYHSAEEFAEAIRIFAKEHGGTATTADVKRWFQDQFAERIQQRREFERTALKKAKAQAEKELQNRSDRLDLAASGYFQNTGQTASTGSGPGSAPSAFGATGTTGTASGSVPMQTGSGMMGSGSMAQPQGSRVNPYLLLLFAFLLFAGGVFLIHRLFFAAPPQNELTDKQQSEVLAAANESDNLYVSSEPGHADLYINGKKIGTTGLGGITCRIEPGQLHMIVVRKEGFKPYEVGVPGEASGMRRIKAELFAEKNSTSEGKKSQSAGETETKDDSKENATAANKSPPPSRTWSRPAHKKRDRNKGETQDDPPKEPPEPSDENPSSASEDEQVTTPLEKPKEASSRSSRNDESSNSPTKETKTAAAPAAPQRQWYSGSGDWSGAQVISRGCARCHGVSIKSKSEKQWKYFFARRRHSRYARLDHYFSTEELNRALGYILNTLDTSNKTGLAGVR